MQVGKSPHFVVSEKAPGLSALPGTRLHNARSKKRRAKERGRPCRKYARPSQPPGRQSSCGLGAEPHAPPLPPRPPCLRAQLRRRQSVHLGYGRGEGGSFPWPRILGRRTCRAVIQARPRIRRGSPASSPGFTWRNKKMQEKWEKKKEYVEEVRSASLLSVRNFASSVAVSRLHDSLRRALASGGPCIRAWN